MSLEVRSQGSWMPLLRALDGSVAGRYMGGHVSTLPVLDVDLALDLARPVLASVSGRV